MSFSSPVLALASFGLGLGLVFGSIFSTLIDASAFHSSMLFKSNGSVMELNKNNRDEIFIYTNIEWQNNADDDQLILVPNTSDQIVL